MKILTTYPGQAPRITEAPEHIVQQLQAGREFPFVVQADRNSERFTMEVIRLGLSPAMVADGLGDADS